MYQIVLQQLYFQLSKFVLPGGTGILSDEWAAYFVLQTQGYDHGTVNHSDISLIQSHKYILTQWKGAGVLLRRKIKTNTNPDLLETHFIESCWRRGNKDDIFSSMVAALESFECPNYSILQTPEQKQQNIINKGSLLERC